MLQNKSYCANRFDELVNLKGEVIKGVFRHDGRVYVVLASGFALWFNGAFGIAYPDDVSQLLGAQKDRLSALRRELELVLAMAGEDVN